MTPSSDNLLAEVLRLSEEERGEIAARLIESLDPDADEGAEAAWGEEIRRRQEEIRTGQVQTVPWPEARRLILEDTDEPAEG
jgi:putative addiction module component (TIGR02574 family)